MRAASAARARRSACRSRGVSRSIARLEARLGIRLFERTTRSVRLTDEGRRFYEQVMPLLGALEEATARCERRRGLGQGRLRVNVDPFFRA